MIENETALSGLSFRLAKRVVEGVNEQQSAGTLLRIRQSYITRTNQDLRYSPNFSEFNMSPTVEEKETWDFRAVESFIDNQIKNLPEYNAVALEVVKRYGKQQTHILDGFVRHLIFENSNALKDENLVESVTILLSSLAGQAPDWSVRVFLSNVSAAAPDVMVSENLTLRQPRIEDVQETIPAEWLNMPRVSTGQIYFDSILDVRLYGRTSADSQAYILKVVDALMLFRLGSALTSRYDFWGRTLTQPSSFTIGGMPRFHQAFKYVVKPEDAQLLKVFLDRIAHAIPSELTPESEVDPLDTAFWRYKDALINSVRRVLSPRQLVVSSPCGLSRMSALSFPTDFLSGWL
jgi:hypothetical protein